jgi:hypothetical protein
VAHRLSATLVAATALMSPSAGSLTMAQATDRPVGTADAPAFIPLAARTIVVSPSGDDSRTRLTAAQDPVASIGRAIRLAQPGDTVVVRGGTYVGPAGYGARPGRADAPIRLQNAPGERVVIKGTLQLEQADYWRVSGINVTQDPNGPRKEFLVKFDGGRGWQYLNAEIWGTRGVSNLMISGSERFGPPRDYRIANNCIHDNNAVGDPFMNDHNIYLMPGYDSGPAVIEHNLLFNAENGAAIKAAGPTSATGAARVTIRRNTVVRSAAGVIVGYGSNRIEIRDNLIGAQVKHPPREAKWVANYDAAVIGNHVSGSANVVTRTAVWGFPRALHQTADSTRPIAGSRTTWLNPTFDRTSSCSGFHPTRSKAQKFGRYS